MTASSPRFTGLSLTDELAEATSELLDLGGPSHQAYHSQPPSWPLPSPSPLNLGAGGGATLSTVLAVNDNAKLTLIYDDDEDTDGGTARTNQKSKAKEKAGKTRREASDQYSTDTSSSFTHDGDARLPSSNLNRMVASVSSTPQSSSDSTFTPPLRSVDAIMKSHKLLGKHGERIATMSTRAISTPVDGESSIHSRLDHTPEFFAESFPDARTVNEDASGSADDEGLASPPSRLFNSSSLYGSGLPISEAAKATLSDIDESSITVKLHGNGRLEREAQTRLKEQEEEEEEEEEWERDSRSIQGGSEERDDDNSSLLSLPATSLTNSSGNSSRTRRRLHRRRSHGSASIATEDLETADETPFARDVQVRGFNVVGEKARGFVCYDVRIITSRGTTISILRRFSSFFQLKRSLTIELPQYAALLPSLPPRRAGLLHKYASHHLEKRRRALQKWLAIVMLDSRWGTSQVLREWVVGSSDDS